MTLCLMGWLTLMRQQLDDLIRLLRRQPRQQIFEIGEAFKGTNSVTFMGHQRLRYINDVLPHVLNRFLHRVDSPQKTRPVVYRRFPDLAFFHPSNHQASPQCPTMETETVAQIELFVWK